MQRHCSDSVPNMVPNALEGIGVEETVTGINYHTMLECIKKNAANKNRRRSAPVHDQGDTKQKRAEYMDPCWEAVRSKAREVKFNGEPHGFIVLTKSENPGECFCIEDYSFNRKYQGLINYLQKKDTPVFIIYDYLYYRVTGGNKRGLVLVNWHPKEKFRVGAREIMEKVGIFALVDAKEISDLEPKKFLEDASRGNYALGLV